MKDPTLKNSTLKYEVIQETAVSQRSQMLNNEKVQCGGTIYSGDIISIVLKINMKSYFLTSNTKLFSCDKINKLKDCINKHASV